MANYPEFNPNSTAANTTYVVTQQTAISGTKTIANNVTLIFDGGRLTGTGTLKGFNTILIAPIAHIFNIGLKLEGSWIMDRAYPQWFGAKNDAPNFTDVSYDASPAINKAIEFKRSGEVFIPRGQYVIKDSIRLKFGVILCGEVAGSFHESTENPKPPQNDNIHQGTVISPLRSHTLDGNYMIIVNAKRKNASAAISPTNADWIVPYPHEHTAIKNLRFYHVRDSGGNIKENIKGIIYAGSITIEHCTFRGLIQGATSTNHYSDQRIITDCDFNPNNINSEKCYAFDFYETGDNVCFKRNQVGVWEKQYAALLGALRVNLAYGADIGCNILNHNVLIANSRAVSFYSNHMETDNDHNGTAQLSIYGSVVKAFSNFFEKGILPCIKITGHSEDLDSIVTLDGNDFVYFEGDYKKGTDGKPIHRTISQYDIQTDAFVNLKINSTYRYNVTRSNTIRKSPKGLTICDLDGNPRKVFNDYSYFLSVDGMIMPHYCINRNHAQNTTPGLSSVYAGVNPNVQWKKAESTNIASYSYQMQVIWDINRKIVGKKITVGTFTPTRRTDSAGVPIIDGVMINISSLAGCGYSCTIRLFRQKSGESQICDIPLCGGETLWDNGLDVIGYPWRTETTTDSMANAIIPIDESAIQFAGNNIILNAGSKPTVGAWINGDKVYVCANNNVVQWVYYGGWRSV